jgi:hypothetical protein
MFLKEITDPVFTNETLVYVVAPREYQKIANKTKLSTYASYDINDTVLKRKDQLNIFFTSTIWQNKYINNLEVIIKRKLTTEQATACTKLCNYWLAVQPNELKEYIYAS